MDDISQVRTARGAVRIRGVQPVSDGAACSLADAVEFAFDPIPATDLARASGKKTPGDGWNRGEGLLKLATCVKKGEQSMLIRREALYEFAEKSGPLFGRSRIESLDDWASAVCLADMAASLQQVVNGQRGLPVLSTVKGLTKSRIMQSATGTAFDLYVAVRPSSPAYMRWLGGSRFIRKEVVDGRTNYAFLNCDEGAGVTEFVVASFEHEVSEADYRALMASIDLEEQTAKALRSRMGLGGVGDPATGEFVGGGRSHRR